MKHVTVVVASVAAASAVALGSYWLGRARGSRASDQPRSTELTDRPEQLDGNERLVGAIGNLERRMAALEMRQALARLPAPEAPAAQPQAGKRERVDPAILEEERRERAAAIEAALKTQPRDGVWAPSTESELRTAVDAAVKEGSTYSVKMIKCFTSICEMVLSASSPDELRHTTNDLSHRISGMSSFDFAPTETAADGTATVTSRLFRKGYPRPDQGM